MYGDYVIIFDCETLCEGIRGYPVSWISWIGQIPSGISWKSHEILFEVCAKFAIHLRKISASVHLSQIKWIGAEVTSATQGKKNHWKVNLTNNQWISNWRVVEFPMKLWENQCIHIREYNSIMCIILYIDTIFMYHTIKDTHGRYIYIYKYHWYWYPILFWTMCDSLEPWLVSAMLRESWLFQDTLAGEFCFCVFPSYHKPQFT